MGPPEWLIRPWGEVLLLASAVPVKRLVSFSLPVLTLTTGLFLLAKLAELIVSLVKSCVLSVLAHRRSTT